MYVPCKVHNIGGVSFALPPYFAQPAFIGCGTYGAVVSVIDTRTETKVAVKKIANPFAINELEALETEQQMCMSAANHVRAQQLVEQLDAITKNGKRLYREIKLLRFMAHPNVIGMLDLYVHGAGGTGEDVYIVMPKMGANLKAILSSQALSDDHCQHISYEILRALSYVHSAGIMHRDLKPENIAMNEDMELKILDFGMARAVNTRPGEGTLPTTACREPRPEPAALQCAP